MCHCKKQKKCKISCVRNLTSMADAESTRYQVGSCFPIGFCGNSVMGGTSSLYPDSSKLPGSLNSSTSYSANTQTLA